MQRTCQDCGHWFEPQGGDRFHEKGFCSEICFEAYEAALDEAEEEANNEQVEDEDDFSRWLEEAEDEDEDG